MIGDDPAASFYVFSPPQRGGQISSAAEMLGGKKWLQTIDYLRHFLQ